ncbi:MAG: hypothetical protein L3J09_11795 [Flavobacteriaceae bacterium]|nr:hypothetical protein [Flavobacteriaceae bacterium]
MNSVLIKREISKKNRLKVLIDTVTEQRKVLDEIDIVKSLKKKKETTYIEIKGKTQKD